MADYSQTISNAPNPATADPSLLIAGNESIAKGVLGLGKSIFEGYQGISKGMELQKFENAQAVSEGKFLDELRATESAAGSLDARKRISMEIIDPSSVGNILDEDISASDIAKKATIFDERKASVLSAFEKEAVRINEARAQFPAKEKQYMLRSERALQDFIARNPQYGDDARRIMSQTFGLNNIETYSEKQLSDSIREAEMMRAKQAEAARLEKEGYRKLFIESGDKEGQFVRALQWDKDPVFATQMAQEMTIKKNSEEQLKTFSAKTVADLQRGAAMLTGNTSSNILTQSMAFGKQMQTQFGLTQEQLRDPTTIPDSVKRDSKFAAAHTAHTAALSAEIAAARTQLITMSNSLAPNLQGPDAAAAIKVRDEALASMDMFIKNNPYVATAIAFRSDLSPQEKREYYNTLETLQRTTGITPEVFLALGSEKGRAQFPWQSAAHDLLREAHAAISSGNYAATETAIKKVQDYMTTKPGTPARTKEEFGGKVMRVEDAKVTARNILEKGEADPRAADVMRTLIQDHASNRTLGEDFRAKGGLDTLQKVMGLVPKEMQEATRISILQELEGANYGQGTGDAFKARKVHDDMVNNPKGLKAIGGKAVFTSPEGNAPLKITTQMPKTISPSTSGYILQQTEQVNKYLTNLENSFVYQSTISGEPVETLRKRFIQRFTRNVVTDDAIAKEVLKNVKSQSQPASTSAPSGAGPSGGVPSASGQGGTLGFATEKQLAGQVSSLQTEISQRPLGNPADAMRRLESDIANILEEIKKSNPTTRPILEAELSKLQEERSVLKGKQ